MAAHKEIPGLACHLLAQSRWLRPPAGRWTAILDLRVNGFSVLELCCPLGHQASSCLQVCSQKYEMVMAALDAVLSLQVCHELCAFTINGLDQVSRA